MNTQDDDIDVRHLCPLPHRGHAPDIHPPATICEHHTDTYRDRVTDIRRLWDFLPDPNFVADLGRGSNHSRGTALDLTLVGTDGEVDSVVLDDEVGSVVSTDTGPDGEAYVVSLDGTISRLDPA